MPVLERAGQITAVVDAVTRARTGAGALLLVAGEAGVGKTTLVRAALDELPAGVGRWWGACDPLATPRPLGPWEDMAAREPALASLLHDTDRIAMGAGVLELLREPTVVVVEDVHWVDEASVDLLLYLGRRLQQCRSVLVATYRPVDVTADLPASRLLGLLARSPEAGLLRVEPLSSDAVARLAAGSELDPAELYHQTGGNAFYVTEVLAEPARTVPGTVADAVRARAADLPAEGRELLDLVSLAPSGFEYPAAAELLGEDVAASGLDQIATRDMANLAGDRIVFRHELARLAVAEAVPPGRRRRLHARLLATLDDLPGVDPARLVHHAELAGDRARLLALAPAAADAAERRGAFRAAAAHLERALAVADGLPARARAELWDRLVVQQEHFEARSRVIELRQQAADRWHALGDPVREAHQLAYLVADLEMTNDVARAERMVARALDLVAEEPHRPVAVHVRLRQLELATKHSTPRDLLGAWEQLAEEARRVGAIEAQYHARWHLGVCHARLGEVGRAVTLEDECHALAEQSLPRELGKSTVNIGEALGQGRYHVPAERLLGTAIDLALERDLERMAHYGAAVLARVHLERGRWDQARHTATRWEDHEQDEAGATRGITLAVLGRLDAHQGVVGAAGRVATAWQDVRGTGDLDFLWPTAVASAEAAWIHGDPTAAADVVLATLDLARMTGHPWAVGELTWWARQAGHDVPLTIEVAGPWAAALVGDWATAAEAWEALGCPLDEAIALTAGDVAARRRALDLFIDLDAFADADRLRQSLREAGVTDLPVRDRTRAKPDAITDRQREVLELVAAGLTNADIAQHLYISEKTVGHHVSAILQRLDVRTRTQAVTVARRRGLLTD